jgi:PadR family transcriptional regulator, regulatory protein PadR
MSKESTPARGDVLLGTLEMLVLKTLTRGPLHGYGIAQFIEQTSGDLLRVEEGSLYPALQRLSLKGWVDAEWQTSPNNRRARFYRLTPEGREQLGRHVTSFDRTVEGVLRVLRSSQEG